MPLIISGGGGDADAIHDNVAGEINAITEKATPVAADLVLIEDSAAANVKKKVQVGNIGGGSDILTGTYAAMPAAGTAGDLYLPSDGFAIYRDTGAAWTPFGPFHRGSLVAPPTTGWTWDNQLNAVASASQGGLYIDNPDLRSNECKFYHRAAPSTPYTITAAITYCGAFTSANLEGFGIGFRESSSGKIAFIHLDPSNVRVGKFTSSTVWSAWYVESGANMMPIIWLRIADDGVNRISSYSVDGQHWFVLHTVGRTDFLTADQVGIFMWAQVNASAQGQGILVTSWEVG